MPARNLPVLVFFEDAPHDAEAQRFAKSDVANREEALYRLVDGKLKGRS
jgi:hypothetical protein